MSRFTNILLVSPMADGKRWIIRSDFGYDVGEEGSDESINVPVGFKTDFASIPRILWGVIPRWGRYGNAAVVHDYCYWSQTYTRKRSDEIFMEGMTVLKVSSLLRHIIYFAVRIFGFLAWRNNKRRKERGKDRILEQIPQKTIESISL